MLEGRKDARVRSALSYIIKGIYFVLILLFVVFCLNKQFAFLLFAGFFVIAALLLEVIRYSLGYGFFSDTKQVLAAAVCAIVFLQAMAWLLPSYSPLHFIASCSMLPEYSPGDAVFVWGGGMDVPAVRIDEKYVPSGDALVHFGNESMEVKGSLYAYCSHYGNELCNGFIATPENFSESAGQVMYKYGSCTAVKTSGIESAPCVKSISINGKEFPAQSGASIIAFPASIIGLDWKDARIAHRAIVGIEDSSGSVFYITKGDNNPTFDAQIYEYGTDRGGRAVMMDEVKGRVLFKVPFLGFMSKRFVQSENMDGCDGYYVD